jgi:ankyrin repeat protein
MLGSTLERFIILLWIQHTSVRSQTHTFVISLLLPENMGASMSSPPNDNGGESSADDTSGHDSSSFDDDDEEIDDSDYYCTAFLPEAAVDGDFEAVKEMIKHGKNGKGRYTEDIDTALVHSCMGDGSRIDIIKYILEEGGATVVGSNRDADGDNGESPLTHACMNGNMELVQYLAKYPGGDEAFYDHGSHYGLKPVTAAFRAGHEDVVNYLLHECKLDLDRSICKYSGETLLHEAVWSQDDQFVSFLLERGANVDPICNDGRTPLHKVRDKDTAALLIKKGANLQARDKNGITPLMTLLGENAYAVRNDDMVYIVTQFLKAGSQVGICNPSKNTALHLACANDRLEKVLDVLLAHGADVHVRNNDGDTPFLVAISQQRLDTARHFLAAVPDVERSRVLLARNKAGQGCLVIASLNNQVELVQFLLGNYGTTLLDEQGSKALVAAATKPLQDDSDSDDEQGSEALVAAASVKRLHGLLDSDSDSDDEQEGETPIATAEAKSHNSDGSDSDDEKQGGGEVLMAPAATKAREGDDSDSDDEDAFIEDDFIEDDFIDYWTPAFCPSESARQVELIYTILSAWVGRRGGFSLPPGASYSRKRKVPG